jgi:hypothetical protein
MPLRQILCGDCRSQVPVESFLLGEHRMALLIPYVPPSLALSLSLSYLHSISSLVTTLHSLNSPSPATVTGTWPVGNILEVSRMNSVFLSSRSVFRTFGRLRVIDRRRCWRPTPSGSVEEEEDIVVPIGWEARASQATHSHYAHDNSHDSTLLKSLLIAVREHLLLFCNYK